MTTRVWPAREKRAAGREISHGLAYAGSRLHHQEGVLVEGVQNFPCHGLLLRPYLEAVVALMEEAIRRQVTIQFTRIHLLPGLRSQPPLPGAAPARRPLRESQGTDPAGAGEKEPG